MATEVIGWEVAPVGVITRSTRHYPLLLKLKVIIHYLLAQRRQVPILRRPYLPDRLNLGTLIILPFLTFLNQLVKVFLQFFWGPQLLEVGLVLGARLGLRLHPV